MLCLDVSGLDRQRLQRLQCYIQYLATVMMDCPFRGHIYESLEPPLFKENVLKVRQGTLIRRHFTCKYIPINMRHQKLNMTF